jgi:L-aspartate oxidase
MAGRRVFLDARKLGRTFTQRFPGIYALCRARGIDPRRDLIPVTPAAHYMMGGVVTDLAGRSTLSGLWACGEVSRTGVHGANRLASNSLLEGLVFAERVARDVASVPEGSGVPRRARWKVPALEDRGAAQVAADEIRTIMWERVGIDRNARDLEAGLRALAALRQRLEPGATEEANMVDTALLIAKGALARQESRGGHYRSDFPRPRRKFRERRIEW